MVIEQPPEAFDGIHGCNIIGRRDRSRGKYKDLKNQKLSVAAHEGIISCDLWLRCQEKLEQNTQLCRTNAGKYSWLTGLMKCKTCGYSIKINFIDSKFYLVCSGRSNIGVCTESIHIDLRELESAVAAQLKDMLQQCPPEEVFESDNAVFSEIQKLDQRIDRLVNALAESDGVAVDYISKEIQRSHQEKERLLQQIHTVNPKAQKQHLDFDSLSFQEKKIVAAEFIDRILLYGTQATIIWKV